VRVSERFRKILRERCERLIESGVNCFPRWIDSKSPAFRKGEKYQRFLTVPITEDEDFKKFVLQKFEDPRVGAISIVSGCIGGVLGIDFDAIKVDPQLWNSVKKVLSDYGHMVYVDRRYGIDSKGALHKHGVHIILFSDSKFLSTHRIKIKHSYNVESGVKKGLITIYPSIYITKEGNSIEFSAYVRLSHADIFDTTYDESLEIAKKIIEILGGELQVSPITSTGTVVLGEESNEPWHGFKDGQYLDQETVWIFLRNFAKIEKCEGLLRFIESLQNRDPMTVTYFIYSDIVPNTDHPRSSWTIVENAIFRLLAEVGAADAVFGEIRGAFKESEDRHRKIVGEVPHESLDRNMEQARRFNEHGHDKVGACVFKVAGLCHRDCNTTCWLKIKDGGDSILKALHLALKRIEIPDEGTENA